MLDAWQEEHAPLRKEKTEQPELEGRMAVVSQDHEACLERAQSGKQVGQYRSQGSVEHIRRLLRILIRI